jgi:hypothetical protein
MRKPHSAPGGKFTGVVLLSTEIAETWAATQSGAGH